MYSSVFYDYKTNLLHIWDDTIGYFNKKYQRYAYIRNTNGEYTTLFGERASKIYSGFDRYRDTSLFESDISPEIRYIIDNYTHKIKPSKQNIMFFDIETEIDDNGFPDIDRASQMIISICFFLTSQKRYTIFAYDPDRKINKDKIVTKDTELRIFDSEMDMLKSIIYFISHSRQTIMSAWNGEGFDVPYLIRRIERILGREWISKMSPINLALTRKGIRDSIKWRFAGFSLLDYLAIYKKFNYAEKSSYKLDDIAFDEIGQKKLEFSGSLRDLWTDDRTSFIEYNKRDVKLLVDMEEKLRFLELAVTLSHICHIPYESVFSPLRLVDSAILTYLKEKDIIAPSRIDTDQYNIRFTGAYVKDPQIGLYEWVYDLDFASLYPSTIISLNLSPETKITKIDKWSINDSDDTVYLLNKKEYTKKEIREICKENNLSVSANGVVFQMDQRGIFSEIIDKWLSERSKRKDLMKKFSSEGNITQQRKYNTSQLAFKVLANSAYGVIATPYYRFFDLDLAEAITLTGQAVIKYSQEILNKYYNEKLQTNQDYVLAIDTDSLFASILPLLDNEKGDMEDKKEKIDQIQNYINREIETFARDDIFINTDIFKHRWVLKQEIIADTALFIAKKRYGLHIIDKEGVAKDELDVKGIDIVRSSYSVLFKQFLKKILIQIFNKKTKEEIDIYILDFKKFIKSRTIEEIATPTGVKNITKFKTRNGQFKKRTPVHVKASINFNKWIDDNNLSKKYNKINNGSKIKWIYLNSHLSGMSEIAFLTEDGIPKELEEYIKDKINFTRLLESSIDSKVMIFYNALGWSKPINPQNTLARFF